MGRIVLSKEEQSELESSNVLIKPHEAAVRPGYGIYHNPATGKEITHPIDPYHMMKRLRQGWKLGSAPAGLAEAWAAKQAGVEPEKPAPEPAEHQLDFFSSVDAPPESETKHVVSQASQPETVGQERLL
jgi:hypothetical protein